MAKLRIMSIILLSFFSSIPLLHATPLKDPFYTQGQEIQSPPPVHSVKEQVDPFSGYLTLLHTDVFIPGNGGLDLTILRRYNSAIWSTRAGNGFLSTLVANKERSPLGLGWSLHMGIVRNPFGSTGWDLVTDTSRPVVEMPDGSQHVLYVDKNDTTRYISKEYWIYKSVSGSQTTWELTLTDGTVYTFEYNLNGAAGYDAYSSGSSYTQIAQVTKIRNAANNSYIEIKYKKISPDSYSYLDTVTLKTSADTTGRKITFNYDTSRRLSSIVLATPQGNKTLISNYLYTPVTVSGFGTYNILSQVNIPVGNPWKYSYYSTNYELQTLTFPAGGTIDYVHTDTPFKVNTTQTVNFCVVTGRTTKTNDSPNITDTWTYQYETGLTSIGNRTTITSLGGLKEVDIFDAWSTTGYETPLSNKVWRVGLPKSKEISLNNTVIYTETLTWTNRPSPSQNPQPISNDDLSSPSWTSGGNVTDYEIYVPLLGSKAISRDGKTYTTTYSDYNTYGDPQTIDETGDKARHTAITYWTNATFTVLNMVKNKLYTVTVSGDFPGRAGSNNFPITYYYYQGEIGGNIGDLKKVDQYGVVTQYEYFTTDGNLQSVTDANGNKTTYVWANGRISEKHTPIPYTVTRVINTDGTIDSETDGRGYGYTTSYDYDDNFRLIKITPPVGEETSFTYQPDNLYMTEQRHLSGYSIRHNYDGFGRPMGTVDTKGISTNVVYKSYGVKDYTNSNVSDKISYDYFGRVTEALHKDGKKISHIYNIGSDERVVDEELYETYYTYNALGNPDEKLLRSVRDAKLNTTSYDYNILGSLTKITQPSNEVNQPGIVRTFQYNDNDFLEYETNPEKGTIHYQRYPLGNIHYKTDGMGIATYGYDTLNRLQTVVSPTLNLFFDYDNADNLTVENNNVGSIDVTYTYDKANRLEYKYETILAKQYTTHYTYTPYDNIETITYPQGRVINYGYNSNDQVNQIKMNGSQLVTNIDYYDSADPGNFFGLPKTYQYSNGHTVSFTYNSRNLLQRYIGGLSGGSAVVDMGYQYYDRGNVWTITNYVDPAKNLTLAYDELNRLTTMSGWASGSYAYYPSGNRWTKSIGGTTSTYNYDPVKNRLSTITGALANTYGYNNDGDLTSMGTMYTFDYDGAHNMTGIKYNSVPVALYNYDGKGMRAVKSSNGKTIVYHYDQAGRVIAEHGDNDSLIADYVYLHGKLVAKIAPIPSTPTNLEACVAYTSQINLKWSDNADNEQGYIIERKASGSSYITIATVAANQNTYPDTGLTPGVTYYYRVSAFNQAGNSLPSDEVSAVPVSNPAPVITVTPTSWDYGTVIVGSAAQKTFSVTNTGTNDVYLYFVNYAVSYGPNAAAYTISADTCSGRTLRPCDMCTFALTFSPQATGTGQGYLNIPSAQLATVNVPITGFGQKQFTLTVQKAGTGTGTVTSSPAGINCGSACSATFNESQYGATIVTLTPAASTCSAMASWTGGGCTGTGPCNVNLVSNTTVTATFDLTPPTADFSGTPTTGIETVATNFTNLSSCATSWSWDFGDAATSVLSNPSHTYTNLNGASYTVSLTASNAVGSNTAAKTNYITVQACSNLPVRIPGTTPAYYLTLQDAYIDAPDGAIIQSRNWNFSGDLVINKNLTLEGGYDCSYSSPVTDFTTLTGSITTNTGTTTIKDFVLQK